MDDYPHESSTLHSLTRKRKADSDDCQLSNTPSNNTADSVLLDTAATPRMPCKPQNGHHLLPSWQQQQLMSTSVSIIPTFCQEGPSRPKRPRIEIPYAVPAASRRLRRGRISHSPMASPTRRFVRRARLVDIRDTGIVSAVEPRRVPPLRTGNLPPPSPSPPTRISHSVPVTPIEPISPHIPSHQPPINRETLKELDLEAILRNPQLRHDLLFDPGLQFRPTFSRRKRDMAENYWVAIGRELESGCTCTTLDASGRVCDRGCVCLSVPVPTGRPIRTFSPTGDCMTVRTVSRLKPLLRELLEVLVSIIQPPSGRPEGVSLHPHLLHPQVEQNISHVSYLRSILDADLIQQEIEHGLFDPSGVFQAIGDIIRCYCAPMRDRAVDQMVTLARSCVPGGTGTKTDAVRAIRQCFEIMELMKLDVANHQLQTLRPYLVHSAAQFELKTFQENRHQKIPLSLDTTRAWFTSAYLELVAQNTASPPKDSAIPSFSKYPRGVQIQVAITKAIVNLIFNSPSSSTPCSTPCSTSSSPNLPSSVNSRYPETLYLDHARLNTLRTDAADFTSLYMLLMLYRQLVHSSPRKDGSRTVVKQDELLALKKEIWEIGPAHLGHCFMRGTKSGDISETSEKAVEAAKWREDIGNVVLQLTMRASEVRSQPYIPTPSSSASTVSGKPPLTPDQNLLKLATSWTESNLRPESSLSVLMKKRVRCAVEDAVVEMILPPSFSRKTGVEAGASPSIEHATSGLEPLMPEIRHLAEKLKKLIHIHTTVYGALYAQPGFLVDQPPPVDPAA